MSRACRAARSACRHPSTRRRNTPSQSRGTPAVHRAAPRTETTFCSSRCFAPWRPRPPWQDGPRDNVQTCFQEACLDTGAFAELVRADPDAALEALLAVCIEEPQYDDFGSNRYRRTGLEHWQVGDPPVYCRRGPFLQFLRDAPEQGLSFIIKLTNFATRCYLDEADHGLRLWSTATRDAGLGTLTSSAGITIGRFLGVPSSSAPLWRWRNGTMSRLSKTTMSPHG